jgi:ribosomal protein S27AE
MKLEKGTVKGSKSKLYYGCDKHLIINAHNKCPHCREGIVKAEE